MTGVSVLRLVCAPLGPDVRLGSVRIAGPGDDPSVQRDDLVLAVGARDDRAELHRLVARAGAAGAAAVVVRDHAAGLRVAATDVGVALLRTSTGTTWDQVYRLAEAVVPAARRTPAGAVDDLDVEGPCAVVAFAPLDEVAVRDPAARDRLLNLVWYGAQLRRPATACGAVGPVCYAVLPADRSGHSTLTGLAAEVVTRVHDVLGLDVCAGVGAPADGPGRVAASRADADRVVAVLRRRTDLGRVAHVDDVQAYAALDAMRGLVHGWSHLRLPQLAVLREHDGAHGTDYVATLRAYLDTFGDAGASAQRLGVHINTFRYRLRRLVTLSRLDLADADQRLVCELELAAGL